MTKRTKPFRSFSEDSPEIAIQWNYKLNGDKTPETTSYGSGVAVWWEHLDEKTGILHEWSAAVRDRNSVQRGGCSICSGNQVVMNINDFPTTDPERAILFHPTKNIIPATQLTRSSNKGMWWRHWDEKLGVWHEWHAIVRSVIVEKRGCAICAGKQVQRKVNDFKTTHPALAEEFHPTKNEKITIYDFTAGSDKKYWWRHRCEKHNHWHEWESTVAHRVEGRGCPICAGKKVLIGCNDLATTNPELSLEIHPTKNGLITARALTRGSAKKVVWRHWHEHSPFSGDWHEWESTVAHRVEGKGCHICKGDTTLIGCNDLATTNPKVNAQLHPTLNGIITGQALTQGSGRKLAWVCENGTEEVPHIWYQTVNARTNGFGCPYCSRQIVLKDFSDCATTHPIIAKLFHPTKNEKATPYNTFANSDKKVYFLCENGHVTHQIIGNRVRSNGLCPDCNENSVSKIEKMFRDCFDPFFSTINKNHSQKVTLQSGEKIYVDIFGHYKEHKIAIEYDGSYYHNDEKALNKDYIKTDKLIKDGWIMLRIRETPLEFLDYTDSNFIQFDYKHSLQESAVEFKALEIISCLDSKIVSMTSA